VGSGAEPRPPAIFLIYTDKIWANFRKFCHLHLHNCVRLPHHSLEKDLSLKFPGLSRAGNFTTRNPGHSRRRGNPGNPVYLWFFWPDALILIFIKFITTIYLFTLRKLVSQLRCGCLVVSELSVKLGRPAIPGVRHSGGPPAIAGVRHSGRQPFGDESDSCARVPGSASPGPGVREYRGPRVSRSLSIIGWLQKKRRRGMRSVYRWPSCTGYR